MSRNKTAILMQIIPDVGFDRDRSYNKELPSSGVWKAELAGREADSTASPKAAY